MVRTASSRFLLGSALAVALLLPACGGDDGDSASDEGASATTVLPVEPDTDDTDDTGGTTADDDDATTTAAGDRHEFCDAYDELDSVTEGLSNDSIEDVREGAGRLVAAVSEAREQVPDEIAEQFDVLAGGISDFRQLAEDADSLEGFQTAVESYDDSEVSPAGDAVDEWYDENC
jgi:hypothetical protein